jgi:hypothetical protein
MPHGARVMHLLQHDFSCSDVTESQVQHVFRNITLCGCRCCYHYTVIEHKKKRYRKRWVASFLVRRNQNLNVLGEVRTDSCALFRRFTKMTANNFEFLLQLIGPSIKKERHQNERGNPNKHAFSCDLAFFSHW